MAPTPKASEKKQQSLTSFFTPKTINGLDAAFRKQAQSQSEGQHDGSPSTRKRPLEDDTDRANRATERITKRARADGDYDSANHSGTTSKASTSHETIDGDDLATRRRNEDLHRRFVKKLGHPDAMSWRARGTHDEDQVAAEDGDADGDAAEEEEVAPTRTKKKGAKTGKLTPMEVQFLDIKRKHMDTILIVEVGYKFRFFGEDARIAAKELSIVCIPGKMRYDEHPSEAHLDRFASASIPVHRLPVHAKRLVAAGHKVGVVRQVETAALKKAGDNRNTPFIRKLTNLYTKGTYIDENGELDQQSGGAPAGGYLLCITETKSKGLGSDEKVDVGILAVQPATGDIIYDTFEDGFMRSEIETRLLHISPCEFLIVGELTKGTDKLIQHLSGSSTNVFGDRSRVERVPKNQTMAAEAHSHVTQFYADKVKAASQDETASALLDKVLKLTEPVTICLSAMINHLKEYGLEHIFDLTKYFQSFSTRSHVLINGTTLESLEVYRNSTDHSERGSLFWAVDKTLTRFGQRLLRKWVGRPLLDLESLEQRLSAVQELLDKQSTAPVNEVENLLSSIKADLERSLIRIYYGKCTRPELLSVLQTLQKIAMHYSRPASPSDSPFSSPLLTAAVGTLPQILEAVVSYLERINLQAARKDDKYGFFRDEYQTEDIQDHQLGIAHVEHELDSHRSVAAQKIKKKSVDYVTVAGIEYLIEVPNSEIKNVPASWSKISGTKKLSRFHTPEVLRLITERDQHREALAAACDKAFKDLLAEISADYQPLRDAVAALASLDCLLSLSKVASQPGYNRPTFLPASTEPTISITQGRHPIAEQTLDYGYIPFTTTLGHPSPMAHLITGPNMGGKSSFVRAFALNVLLAQIGSFVPADALSLTLCDAIHTRTGARDNLFAGESTFMVEVSETARILRSATPRSLVILDELGRGTSTHDGAAIAQSVLQHVVTETRCLTLFITHYQNLARVVDGLDGVSNVHMRFKADVNSDGEEEITFLYEVGEGIAHRSYGLNVARLARIPKKVLDVAAEKSSEMELGMRVRRLKGAYRALEEVVSQDASQHLGQLVASIEQL
ncbi:DNA mismatch repair protein MSH3 [Purpureocillium lilacinum]|uniref:MutS protein homolog 3 n=1 Tax=Purpureocillium lilacinum TaxID=33203 RepID=A0A179HLG8_PURLI|nr:DNA mismatch repair protein MSH3 [Purpureocillium lilacinum]OAQ84357.1 DNA mismatch repair protein MSH3 [Purpureocillium lilacinum]OAQ91147.1 DNA mismatch repair protein MSH3 [Purpureocillium lilacinum]